MTILDIRALRGPNVYHSRPVLVMRLELGDDVDTDSASIAGYVDRLIETVPELRSHRCSRGYEGGFVERLREGTYPAHIVEHVALALAERAGIDIGFGKARHSGEGTIYDVIIRFVSERAMRTLLEGAAALVESLMRGRGYDATAAVDRARELSRDDELPVDAAALTVEATRRAIPWRLTDDRATLLLGYGRAMRRVAVDVARRGMLDRFFPGVDTGRIPIIGVTGSRDATATARALAGLLRAAWRHVGLATSVDEIAEPESARGLLEDGRIEAAVIESTRRGIVRGGLPYDWCDVAIVTAIAGEQVGRQGIEEIGDITHVLSVVAERCRAGGTIVLDADDDECVRLAGSDAIGRLPRRIILTSRHADSSIIAAHVAGGGTAIVEREGEVVELSLEGRRRIAGLGTIALPVAAALGALGFGATADGVAGEADGEVKRQRAKGKREDD